MMHTRKARQLSCLAFLILGTYLSAKNHADVYVHSKRKINPTQYGVLKRLPTTDTVQA